MHRLQMSPPLNLKEPSPETVSWTSRYITPQLFPLFSSSCREDPLFRTTAITGIWKTTNTSPHIHLTTSITRRYQSLDNHSCNKHTALHQHLPLPLGPANTDTNPTCNISNSPNVIQLLEPIVLDHLSHTLHHLTPCLHLTP